MDLKELTNEELDKKIKEYKKAIVNIEKEQTRRRKEVIDSRVGKYYKISREDETEFLKVVLYSGDSLRGYGYYCQSITMEDWDDGTGGIGFWFDFHQDVKRWEESTEEEYNEFFATALDKVKKEYSNEVKIND